MEPQLNTQVIPSVVIVNGLNQEYTTAVKLLQQLLNRAAKVSHAHSYTFRMSFLGNCRRD